MSRRVSTLAVSIALAVALLTIGPTAALAIITWASPVSGDWSDSTKWNPQQVPGPDDIAFINVQGTYTVTIDVDVHVERLSFGTSTGIQTIIADGRSITADATPNTFVSGAVVQLLNGTVITGTGAFTNLARVELDSSSVQTAFTNSDELIVTNACSITGAMSAGTNSVITLTDSATLTVANGFTNSGDILLSANAASLVVSTGVLTNASSGLISSSGAGATRTLGTQLDNQGVLNVGASLNLIRASADHTNSGTINCTGGTFTVTQSGVTPSLTNTGTINVSAGLTVTSGNFVNASGGLIAGDGVINVSGATFSNAGDVAPGASAGLLNLTGDYVQGGTGALKIELGGLVMGAEYDRLMVSDEATLNGALEVSLIDDFFPSVGNTFTVLTYDSHFGTFSDTTSLDLGGGIVLRQQYGLAGLTLIAVGEPDVVYPVDPGACITPATLCPTIPFVFERGDDTPVRAYHVDFTISSEIELCDGLNSIVEGPFLEDYCGGGCTTFQVNDNGGGSYTVDATILGSNCGPTTGGTLFTVDVTHSGSDGIATITVDSVAVRSCTNQPVPGEPGEAIAFGIDVAYPAAIANLAAVQMKSGNDTDGSTRIQVTFSGNEAGHAVEVYRKGYGDYPEYGTGAVPTPPSDPDDAVASGWTLSSVTASGQMDEPATRDYWYYAAFVISDCDLISPVSNITGGTLNYHLGDVSNGTDLCQGDNSVGVADLSFLGAHYFKTGGDVDPVNCLDFGPTDDYSVDGRPVPDDAIDFDDLVLFGINFGEVAAPIPPREIAPDENPQLVLSVGEMSADQETVTARLSLVGNASSVKGIHSVAAYDPAKVTLIDVGAGDHLADQPGIVFFEHQVGAQAVTIDAVIIGRDLTFSGSGEIAVLRFKAHTPGAMPKLVLVDLRDDQNRFLADQKPGQHDADPGAGIPEIPTVTRLVGARPNPFSGSTAVVFHLATETTVGLRIYDVAGRLVRSMGERTLPAGEHSWLWNGMSDGGARVSPGIYFTTFSTGETQETQKVLLLNP